MNYADKLKDPRWQKKRLKIMERANWECECCGNANKTLHIHHNHYQPGFEPWEYRDDTLYCLCEDCHIETQSLRSDLALEMAKIPPGYEDEIMGCLLEIQNKWKPKENS